VRLRRLLPRYNCTSIPAQLAYRCSTYLPDGPFLSSKLLSLRNAAEEITLHIIEPMAENVDRNYIWPAHAIEALAKAGLTGLQVPEQFGGHGQGLLALAVIA
jgi:alkylation response protein AidB-like acyl-CoA dehydrogenase